MAFSSPVTVIAATFSVNNVANSGPGSLRQAIVDANLSAGLDEIHFSIPGPPPFSIQPFATLPDIIEPVTIDATTQPGFAGKPVIELRGDAAGLGANGFSIFGGGTTIRGLVINRFNGSGIWIENGNANTVQGNYIGLNTAGTSAFGNGQFGVVVLNSSSNTFGGTVSGARNVVSGNALTGLILQGTCWRNTIQANYIGSDATGAYAVRNGDNGIFLVDAATNLIGGASAEARNVISGNGLSGIAMQGAAWNEVQGNYLGPDATGSFSLGGQRGGVNINPGFNNVIGATNKAARNVISGNSLSGILLQNGASKNLVQGNFIGLGASGGVTLQNGENGILIGGAPANTVSHNMISGNGLNGVEIANSGAFGNLLKGNFIGVDPTGSSAVGNANAGVFISAASDNVVGGSTPEARNVISGNHLSGVGIGGAAFRNKIQGNFIGVDVSGLNSLGNDENGILIYGGGDNLIGGTAGEGNTISANGFSGVELADDTSGNQVSGNFIGTDFTGKKIVGQQAAGFNMHGTSGNIIGGAGVGAGNAISGHALHGVRLWDGSSGNLIQGNRIGTDVSGKVDLGNMGAGVMLENASNNRIGGEETPAGNIIAFNQVSGILVESGSGNLIRGNSVFANAGMGIDLGGDGITPNDPTDADTGANQFQNFPILTEALFNPDGSATIAGILLSKPNSVFTLEFFSNGSCDPGGNGEGQEVLGFQNVNTGVEGSNFFVLTFTNMISPGTFITALATDADNNTSEFSACATLVVAPERPEIGWTFDGDTIVLSWPELPPGWRLEAQTNAPGVGLATNWVILNEFLLTNNASFPIDSNLGGVFFRLIRDQEVRNRTKVFGKQ